MILPSLDFPQSAYWIPDESHLKRSRRTMVRRSTSTRPVHSQMDVLEEMKKIPNLIGDYVCQLCCKWFPNALALADHPCSRIACVTYPCGTCGKVFNCPANLASHRRWHRPTSGQSQKSKQTLGVSTAEISNHNRLEIGKPNECTKERQSNIYRDPQRGGMNSCECINISFKANKPFRLERDKVKPVDPFSVEALLA
ncbi:hypothetical protein T265_10548 [Opisthorchis viverrini]|uniref:C2H2-type domain-containing protein n=1 Tax=Opisthorchis viverrini TaxID=6198 RepID=A0A074Z214_OPIVI|nr:hypothetical protein T265_10548 [Opisthorchis viverrini]KER21023.1 hypothetical protein T265_10548 [Opisthorchis viverrini]